MSYIVRGSSVRDTSTLTVAAYIENNQVAVDEIFANVLMVQLCGTPGRDECEFMSIQHGLIMQQEQMDLS